MLEVKKQGFDVGAACVRLGGTVCAARSLGIDVSTLRRYRQAGEAPVPVVLALKWLLRKAVAQ